MTDHPDWWDHQEWTEEQRHRRLAELRADLGDEVEMLDDPHYIKVGERFGGYICYSGQELGEPDYFKFVDYGPYLPTDDRPPHVKSDYRYGLYLHEQDDKRHEAKMAQMRKEQLANNPAGQRLAREQWMDDYVEDRDPDVPIFCSATMTDGPCWERIGSAWHTPRGYYLVGQVNAMKSTIPAHLESAAKLLDQGDDPIARLMVTHELMLTEMIDNDDLTALPLMTELNDPKPGDGMPPWLVLGCPRHLGSAIDYGTLRSWVKEAYKSGTSVGYDCSARVLGDTVNWTASEQ